MATLKSTPLLPVHANEAAIEYYKKFFLRHLAKTANREAVLMSLHPLIQKHKSHKATASVLIDKERLAIEQETTAFLSNHWGEEMSRLYEEDAAIKPAEKKAEREGSVGLQILAGLADMFKDIQEKEQANWKKKTDFLERVYSCLYYFGLHPDIEKREAGIFKRYSLLMTHYHRSRTPQLVHVLNRSWSELTEKFLRFYAAKKPVQIEGVLIPFDKIHSVRIFTTLLKDDEITLFAIKHNFSWTSENRDVTAFISASREETEQLLPNPHADEIASTASTSQFQAAPDLQWLLKYRKAHKLYVGALEKHRKNEDARNVLDDLRLSLELFLQGLFSNKKSLENQMSFVGDHLKQKGASGDIRQLFHAVMDFYKRYQNNNVKHADEAKAEEIPLVLELTTSLMKNLASQ